MRICTELSRGEEKGKYVTIDFPYGTRIIPNKTKHGKLKTPFWFRETNTNRETQQKP